jgi:hypothetical protein
MEHATGIIIPVLADYVLSPTVIYSDELTGIYFDTHDEQFGRITFNNLDAIKVCRGENMPFHDGWEIGRPVPWVYFIEQSKWLKERFRYEEENYGSAYEFGGNVSEMLTDFKHYVFKFHDQFVEVIARGFWFEKGKESLLGKPLTAGHPFLPFVLTNEIQHEYRGIGFKIIHTTHSLESAIENTAYCQQRLMEIWVEFKGEYSVAHTLFVFRRNGNVMFTLRDYFGRAVLTKKELIRIEEIMPLLNKYLDEVAERRK